ncbi:hypothetical protein [Streptomyces albidoflavus]|uniref:hypothetical protein n=1 Tax=Streptomyces albidoflavus TaxID=1886 RepID=UPI0034556DA3
MDGGGPLYAVHGGDLVREAVRERRPAPLHAGVGAGGQQGGPVAGVVDPGEHRPAEGRRGQRGQHRQQRQHLRR